MKYAVIGGGFFGLYLAHYLSLGGGQVSVFEKEKSLMSHASYNNQARVHNGYHYPRSVLTALRSRISFPKFIKEFPDCIYSDFDKYYMIGQPLGKVTAKQFYQFCLRIGAEIGFAPQNILNLVNKQYIEAVFSTKEYAFDTQKLLQSVLEKLDDKIKIWLETEVNNICQNSAGQLVLSYSTNGGLERCEVDQVFNCTYSRINFLNSASGLALIPLKHEMTEMCLVNVPEELQNVGLTVMCGPFFSVMPFPSVKCNGQVVHSFSHVRYTPHYEWIDGNENYLDAHEKLKTDPKNSAWNYMKKDASRYIPLLDQCHYIRSLWEVKTVLPRSETDDSRPILCRFNYGMKGYHCIMGGKIDNIYDAIKAIQTELRI